MARHSRTLRTTGLLVALLLAMAASRPLMAQTQSRLYWASGAFGQPNSILWVNLDGSGGGVAVADAGNDAWQVAVDPINGRLYWSTLGVAAPSVVMAADLDGGNSEVIATLTSTWPGDQGGVALDMLNSKLYFGDPCTFEGECAGTIRAAGLDGSNAQTAFAVAQATAIAVAPELNKICWTENDNVYLSGVFCSDMDGNNPVWIDNQRSFGIDIDPLAGKVYWSASSYGTIRRANLDGTNHESAFISGAGIPEGLALDVDTNGVFWIDRQTVGPIVIRRASLDGTGNTIMHTVGGFSTGGLTVLSIQGPGGEVPDGGDLPGNPLTVGKLNGSRIRLAWEPSCRTGDNDYAVYQAPLDDPGDLSPVTCSTNGRLHHDFAPPDNSTLFLAVPTDGTNEGSYGDTSSGGERVPGPLACRPQFLGHPVCP